MSTLEYYKIETQGKYFMCTGWYVNRFECIPSRMCDSRHVVFRVQAQSAPSEQVRIRNRRRRHLTTPLTKLTSAHNVFKIARAFHSFLNTQMRLQWNRLIPYRPALRKRH